MDEYKQVGPEKPGYREDVATIQSLLESGKTVVVQFAAKMTSIPVVLGYNSPFAPDECGVVAYGPRPAGFSDADALFVGVNGYECAFVPTAWELHWSDTQPMGRHWGDHEDGHPFADFINDVLGHERSPVETEPAPAAPGVASTD